MFGLTRAPELDRPGLTWFNSPAPVSLDQKRGRILLVDFWTPCCVNCHQARPVLDRVARTLSSTVDVIGVLSPKYPWERDPNAAALAVERLEITHPVVHDPHRVLWSQYAARAWPTLVIINAKGMVVGHLTGEPDPDRLEDGLRLLIRQGLREGGLTPAPSKDQAAPKRRSPHNAPPTLRFPTGLHPGPWPGTLALADTGNHRVLILDRSGPIRLCVGAESGFVDGPLEDARFFAPQAVISSPDGAFLIVADTGNHALRRIDLRQRRVDTLAGQGWRGPPLLLGQDARNAILASPWDLALDGDHLYFTNAGTHQIGLLDLLRSRVRPLAGTGEENLLDGLAEDALFSQPTGLALDQNRRILWVTDAESSALRAIHLPFKSWQSGPWVETAFGKGPFTFGDRDGDGEDARTQHPTALALLEDGSIVIADSYNNSLRHWDPATGHLRTLSGDWSPELAGGEPRGVSTIGPGRLAVSLCNRHRILEVDIEPVTATQHTPHAP